MAEVRIFELDGTARAVLQDARNVDWSVELQGLGRGSFDVARRSAKVAAEPDMLEDRKVVRIVDGHVTSWWLIDGEQPGPLVSDRVAGGDRRPQLIGLTAILAGCRVEAERGMERDAPDERIFGPASRDYDASDWPRVAHAGRQFDNTVGGAPGRSADWPAGWVDRYAYYIHPTDAGGPVVPGKALMRIVFETVEDLDAIIEGTADDELIGLWIDQRPYISPLRGPGRWVSTYRDRLALDTADDHVAYAIVNNLLRPYGNSPSHLLFSMAKALNAGWFVDPEDMAVATDEVQRITVTATGGTVTLTFEGETSGAIALPTSASALEAALTGLPHVGADGLQVVEASAGVYDVTFDGPSVRARNVEQIQVTDNLATGGTVTVATTTEGDAPNVILRSHPGWSGYGVFPVVTMPGMTAGQILRLLIEEAAARGALPADTVISWTDTVDSDGVPWPREVQWTWPVVTTSILSVARELAGLDAMEDLDVVLDGDHLRVDAWATRGSDLSGGDAPVRLIPGLNVLEATYQRQAPGPNDLWIRTREGWTHVDDDALVAAYGPIESGYHEGHAETVEDAGTPGAAAAANGAPVHQYEVTVVDVDQVAAGRDYDRGDWVLAMNRYLSVETMRVHRIAPAGSDADGRRKWKVLLIEGTP